MSSKGATGGPGGHKLKLALDIVELMMKSKKKKLLGVFNGSSETYTRYSGVEGTIAFLFSSKRKKVLKNLGLYRTQTMKIYSAKFYNSLHEISLYFSQRSIEYFYIL